MKFCCVMLFHKLPGGCGSTGRTPPNPEEELHPVAACHVKNKEIFINI